MYVNYHSALEMCGIESLHIKREHRSLKFELKCRKHNMNQTMFPLNPSKDTQEVQNREKYKVNKSHTEAYKKSTIPTPQRKVNGHFLQSQEQSPKT